MFRSIRTDRSVVAEDVAAGRYSHRRGQPLISMLTVYLVLLARELLNLAEDGDEKAVSALNRQASFLGQGLRIIASVLSPELILLTGGLTTSWKRFGPIVEKELAKDPLAGEAPRISVMTDVESDRLRGAAALVLQRHSGSKRHSMNESKPKRKLASER